MKIKIIAVTENADKHGNLAVIHTVNNMGIRLVPIIREKYILGF